ncbi:MAG: exodeoxyribonuclease III [Synergistaceae bacterium]|nr:exodeoxyribonuclease III [Synergistaceae bacterium]
MRNKIKIATFNVNSIRSRLEILSRWIEGDVSGVGAKKNSAPDVICIQETKAEDKDFPVLSMKQLGYECAYCGEKSYNGVAILSKEPLDEVFFGFNDGEKENFPTRVIYAKYKGIRILNTYVPQGKEITHPDYIVKLGFLDRISKFMDDNSVYGVPFVWLGDMNVAPTEIDLTNPKTNKENVCFYLPLREKFSRVTNGLVDLFRKFHPEAGFYSFFSYLTKDSLLRNIGWRVDHILATECLAERACGCHIDTAPRGWDRPSDHVPVVAEFLA